MAGTIRARVRHGMLELLEKVDLPEGKEVSLTILGIDEAICKIFGQERGRLRSTGMLIY